MTILRANKTISSGITDENGKFTSEDDIPNAVYIIRAEWYGITETGKIEVTDDNREITLTLPSGKTN